MERLVESSPCPRGVGSSEPATTMVTIFRDAATAIDVAANPATVRSNETTRVEITATVRTTGRTGVEMEALTAVSVAGLAVIDMIKAIDRAAVITDVRVLAKSGGRRGDWERP